MNETQNAANSIVKIISLYNQDILKDEKFINDLYPIILINKDEFEEVINNFSFQENIDIEKEFFVIKNNLKDLYIRKKGELQNFFIKYTDTDLIKEDHRRELVNSMNSLEREISNFDLIKFVFSNKFLSIVLMFFGFFLASFFLLVMKDLTIK